MADRAKLAAAGLDQIGGASRLTKQQLDEINRTLQQGLDAYHALGKDAPAELQKVAAAVQRQQVALSSQGKSLTEAKTQTSLFGQASALLGGQLAAVAGPAALGLLLKQSISYADTLTKLSDRTGIGVVALQRLEAVALASGNSIDDVTSGINQFQKRLASGDIDAPIRKLGLSIQDLRSQSPDAQFISIAKAIQTIKDPAEQVRVAMEVFGRSGAQLLPSLKANVDELANSTFTMSAQSVKALDDFGDAIGRAKTNAINFLGELAGKTITVTLEVIRIVKDILPKTERSPTRNEGANDPAFQAARQPALASSPLVARGQNGLPTLPPGALQGGAFQAFLSEIPQGLARTNDAIKQVRGEMAALDATAAHLGLTTEDYQKQLATVNAKIRDAQAPIQTLTTRQQNFVLTYRALGLSTQEIALKLGVTTRSVQAFDDAVKFQNAAVITTRKVFGDWLAVIPSVNSKSQELANVMDGLTREGLLPAGDTVSKFNKHLLNLKDIGGEATGPMKAFRAEAEKAGQVKSDGLDELARSLTQLSQVSGGGPFGAVADSVGQVVNALDLATKASDAFASGSKVAASAAAVSYVGLFVGLTNSINDAFEAREAREQGQRFGESLGRGISDALAESIRQTRRQLNEDFRANPLNAGTRFIQNDDRTIDTHLPDGRVLTARDSERVASLLNTSRAIQEAGGIVNFGVDKAIGNIHRLFDEFDTGLVSVTRVGDEFDRVFAELLPSVLNKATGLVAQPFVELQQAALARGVSSPALDEFRTQQTTGALGGFGAFLTTGNEALKKSQDAFNRLIDLNKELGSTSGQEQDRIRQEIAKTTAEFDTQQKLLGLVQVNSQAAATAIAGGIFASFTELQRSGASITEALATVTPQVDALRTQLARAGLDGGESFATLERFVTLASDQIAGPALSAVGGLGEALAGLSNTGLLTQEMFSGISTQVTDTFAKLVAEGKNGDDALRLMQPTLQTIFELQDKFGLTVDAGTQALLDQAKAAGVVGEEFKPVQERQLDATNKVVAALDKLNTNFERLVPSAKTAASGISDAFGAIRVPPVNIHATWTVDEFPGFEAPEGASTGGRVTARGIQHFAGGGVVLPFLRRGTDTVPAMLTPGEVVLNEDQQRAISSAFSSRGTVVNFQTVNDRLDAMRRELSDISRRQPQETARAVRDVLRKSAGGRH